MNPALRLAEIISALEQVGLTVLVMGGHAVRYYGLDRNTIDYNLLLSPAGWDDLGSQLNQSTLAAGRPLARGPSWLPGSFQRFLLGQLPDGRDEWLEFWRNNHLLPPFADLYGRREEGTYGGRTLAFSVLARPDPEQGNGTREGLAGRGGPGRDPRRPLASPDDGRHNLSRSGAGPVAQPPGSGELLAGRVSEGPDRGPASPPSTRLSITQAILLPFAGADAAASVSTVPMEPVVVNRLRTVAPASTLHLALIEVVRRQYKLAMQNADAADKQAIRATQVNLPANNP